MQPKESSRTIKRQHSKKHTKSSHKHSSRQRKESSRLATNHDEEAVGITKESSQHINRYHVDDVMSSDLNPKINNGKYIGPF